MHACAPSITALIFANLAAADIVMRLCCTDRHGLDPFTFHRQSIEKHGQTLTTKLDALIDAGRDVVAHSVKAKPNEAFAQATNLFASNVPILQRLAVFGIAHATRPTADEKLRWLLQHNLIYQYKTDVFRFLELNYPNASDDLRRHVVDAASAGPTGKRFDGISEDRMLDERF